MSSRQSREAGGVLSFTFLDVLTCTMGSLVLLVVVLGERAADIRLEDALRNGPKRGDSVAPSSDASAGPTKSKTSEATTDKPTAAEIAAELAELRKQEADLTSLRRKATERLDEETARVTHLEEHERRLERELAELHVTLQRLEETESQQTVDQATAENELKRLKQLIADTEKQLAEARSEPAGKKSYAIVPYDGKSGTHRRPIYVECTADAVIIQPEGIRLSPWDFKGPTRSGNPLASAIRAAHEELNQRSQAAGDQELPDAYPLIIVRPDAAHTYRAVVSAVDSWDVQYGYELVDADWELEYPEPDPRLTQVMTHAVEQARQRQALLAKAAPRTYSAVPEMTAAGDFASGGGGSAGGGSMHMNHSSRGSANITTLRTPGEDFGLASTVSSSQTSFSEEIVASGISEAQPREMSADASGSSGGSSGTGGPGESLTGGPTGNGGDALAPGGPNSMAATGAGGSPPSTAGMTAPPAQDVHKLESTAGAGHTTAPVGTIVQAVDREPPTESAATTRGSNWANSAATQRAAPITRPIKVVVRTAQLDVLGDADGGAPTATDVISFDQPTSKVLDEIAATVKDHMAAWGLAGKSMYWRPTLVLQVAPGAERHAIRIRDLLRDSGVDVRFQDVETAARPAGEAASATR